MRRRRDPSPLCPATPSTRCPTRRWLKITSVYSVVATGRHALFQDADVVWLRDPIEYFFTQADDQVDCFFMDDGARSARYTPLYTNSGFYFIRNNMRTQFFMHRMLMAYDTVLAVRSHQHALIMLLLEHMARHGLTVAVLEPLLFPQGQIFHRKKAIMQSLAVCVSLSATTRPCWLRMREILISTQVLRRRHGAAVRLPHVLDGRADGQAQVFEEYGAMVLRTEVRPGLLERA